MKISLGNREIREENPPYFIADIAANHDGSLERALKLIELAKAAGADAAKFQNFQAETIISKKGFDMVGNHNAHQSKWKKSVYDVYKDASVPNEWTLRLKERCDAVGIEYLTTPYNEEILDVVDSYVNFYKIGSGDATWLEFLEKVAKKNKPVLLATGACTWEEVKLAVATIEAWNEQLIIMQCNTNYTASIENMKHVNLNVLTTYKEAFPSHILGLSDHTPGYITVLGAVALGARVVEKHFTDDNDRVGPDHKFSMNPNSWREMVSATMDLFSSLGDGVKRVEENEMDSRVVQQRSLYLTQDKKKGSQITREDLEPLRPLAPAGIPASDLNKVIGKTLKKDMHREDSITWKDI